MRDLGELVAGLTLDEKASLTAGRGLWHTQPVERAGIPSWRLTDGPSGARGPSFDRPTPSLCVPCGTALGATWDPALLEELGAAVAEQARTKGARVLLAPTVNLHRSPLGGRTFESYSEDPLLTGLLAAGFVRGVQSRGVAATVKHLAGNESEHERFSMDSAIDERTLRELYLLPFELAVRDGGALAVMSAYNRLNGTWCGEHPELLRAILRDEWGFDGFVMSDWYAVGSTVGSSEAGLDLEMPGPARALGSAVADAVRAGELDEAVLDRNVGHLLGAMARLGALDDPMRPPPEQVDDRPEHRAVARRAAVEGTVLLRNDGVLPLDVASLRTIAVIGPNAARAQIVGGGSATLEPHHRTSVLGALRHRLAGVELRWEPGCDIDRGVPALVVDLEEVVLRADGTEALRRTATTTRLLYAGPPVKGMGDDWRSVATATFVPEVDGAHVVSIAQSGRARVLLDGVVVVDGTVDPPPRGHLLMGMLSEEIRGEVALRAGTPVELRIEWSSEGSAGLGGVIVGLKPLLPPGALERAVAAAAAADVAVVVVGTNDDWETEGEDRASLALPGDQDDLVRAVCAANPRTVVVLNAGAPVELPWADDVAALVVPWFGGQEMADAVVDVLTGVVDPGGRLPTTFPLRIEHTPAFGSFPGEGGVVRYAEGLLVGYRWYGSRQLPVRFPFGHGLSYTTFAIGEPEVVEGATVEVRVPVTNTGTRAGTEVVQLYVEPVDPPVARPRMELKAFAKVHLAPGEAHTVTLELGERSFAYWQPDTAAYGEAMARARRAEPLAAPPASAARGWRVAPGAYRLHVGRSSADIAHVAEIAYGA